MFLIIMQPYKGVQLVLLLVTISTCLTFSSQTSNMLHKIEGDNFQTSVSNLKLITHSLTNKSNIFSLKSREKLRSIIQERIHNVENLCVKHEKTRRFETVISKMIIDVKNGISWCPIYKAASSTWMKKFAELRGILTDDTKKLVMQNLIQINTLVNKVYQNELNISLTLEKINETKIFMVVRHPFERLLSAYRDKLEHIKGREYYYRRYGRHITYKYRKIKKENETRIEPLFVEFLQFIAKEKYFDEHWAPYYETCMPCDINYDYILNFENFEEEYAFLLLEIGLPNQINFNYKLKNSNSRRVTTKSVIENYYKNVPVTLLKEIYNVYETDFKLFSYSPEEYYVLGKKS